MARIIGIDYGTKRVGLAVTDPLQIIASPLETVHSKDIIEYLKEYFKNEEVEAIVLGMPKNLKNKATHATQHVVQFKYKLAKAFPDMPLHLMDERFTSSLALDAMIAGGSTKKQRQEKGAIDKVSAAIILKDFMEKRANAGLL